MAKPMVFGASYSVYVRSVRLALAEKGVDYTLVEVDVFAPGGPPAEHLRRQPFGKIPAFEYDGFRLYEAGAIFRYVDEAFPGPNLQPADPQLRARMNQAISIVDSYAYPHLVWGIFVERVSAPARGRPTDQARVAAAMPKAATALAALAAILGDQEFLAGERVSLADLHAAPMLDYAVQVPEVAAMLRQHARLATWWERMQVRQSMLATRPVPRA
jgi:glutathione S-transferase